MSISWSSDEDGNEFLDVLPVPTPRQGGSNACNSLVERDAAIATSVKQEAHTFL
jgi:hypothetical protein